MSLDRLGLGMKTKTACLIKKKKKGPISIVVLILQW